MKVCTKCKIEKDESEFYKHKRSNDGYNSWCKECSNKNTKKWQRKNKEYVTQSNKQWRKDNPDKVKKYEENKLSKPGARERKNKQTKDWQRRNKEYIKEKQSEYTKKRMKNDPLFKMSRNIRSLIGHAFRNKGFKKNTKTAEILGCTFEELYEHLQKTCKNNYNCSIEELKEYQIDHIIPLASCHTEEEVVNLNHYTNLQILTPKDNLAKRDSIIES